MRRPKNITITVGRGPDDETGIAKLISGTLNIVHVRPTTWLDKVINFCHRKRSSLVTKESDGGVIGIDVSPEQYELLLTALGRDPQPKFSMGNRVVFKSPLPLGNPSEAI